MHDYIQPAELVCGVLNSCRSAVRSFQVERQGNRRQALLLKSIGNRLGSVQGAIGCRDVGAALGEAIANLVTVLPVSVVIVAGGIGARLDALRPSLNEALERRFAGAPGTRVEVRKGTTEMLPTGLVLAIPPGWEGQVRCRSGLGKRGLILPNGVGTIDADYRGELMVLAHWIGEGDSFVVEKGERIGQ